MWPNHSIKLEYQYNEIIRNEKTKDKQKYRNYEKGNVYERIDNNKG